MLALVSVASCHLSMFIACVALNVSQPYRLYFLLPILLFALLSFITINHLEVIALGLGQLWGHVILLHITHNTAVLCFEKWTLSLTAPYQHWDLRAAYKICLNPQLLNTFREVPRARKVKTNPSRTTFIRTRLCQLFALYLVNEYVAFPIFSQVFQSLSTEDFSPHRKVYFRRLLFASSVSYTS